jgi:hypothetical protein
LVAGKHDHQENTETTASSGMGWRRLLGRRLRWKHEEWLIHCNGHATTAPVDDLTPERHKAIEDALASALEFWRRDKPAGGPGAEIVPLR